jgi:hypothetical protein
MDMHNSTQKQDLVPIKDISGESIYHLGQFQQAPYFSAMAFQHA